MLQLDLRNLLGTVLELRADVCKLVLRDVGIRSVIYAVCAFACIEGGVEPLLGVDVARSCHDALLI